MTGSANTVKAPAAGLRGSGRLAPHGAGRRQIHADGAAPGEMRKGNTTTRNTGRPLVGRFSTMPMLGWMRMWPGTGSRGRGERSGAFGSPLVPRRCRSSLAPRRGRAPIGMAFALGLVLAMGSPAEAGFADGVAAYDRGEYASAFREFRKAAEHGDATAKAVLGHMYATGQGVARDMASAVKMVSRGRRTGRGQRPEHPGPTVRRRARLRPRLCPGPQVVCRGGSKLSARRQPRQCAQGPQAHGKNAFAGRARTRPADGKSVVGGAPAMGRRQDTRRRRLLMFQAFPLPPTGPRGQLRMVDRVPQRA